MQKQIKLNTIITIFGCMIVLFSLLITDLLISYTTSERIRNNQEEVAQHVSRKVAESIVVKEGLLNNNKAKDIQEYTQEVQALTEVMFVVVMDMEGIRKSHPNPDLIGKKFVGGDEREVLKGSEHVSISTGTLGESLRAFTPVFDENNNQIGAVAVGISLKRVQYALSQNHNNILISSILGVIVGILGAILLAKYIKKMLFGLEPYAISKLLEERSTMLQSVHEGIVAIDQDQKITLVNTSALRIFKKSGLGDDPLGKLITDYMPSSKLDRVMQTGGSERDEELTINGISILVNREPLIVNNKIVGAISTFRDKTEVNQLAKQLTGIQNYVEALRAQSHEFMNRLHVIFGMIQIEAYDEVLEFVRSLIDHKNHEVEMVTKSIKDPVLAGFLMGKLSYVREKKVTLNVTSDTMISEPLCIDLSYELITIIGNLIDNSIEALSNSEVKVIELTLKEDDDQKLNINLTDSGPGIPHDLLDAIFEKGFSTKGPDRGYGLYLVKQSVERLNGELLVKTSDKGTTFKAVIDNNSMRDVIEND